MCEDMIQTDTYIRIVLYHTFLYRLSVVIVTLPKLSGETTHLL